MCITIIAPGAWLTLVQYLSIGEVPNGGLKFAMQMTRMRLSRAASEKNRMLKELSSCHPRRGAHTLAFPVFLSVSCKGATTPPHLHSRILDSLPKFRGVKDIPAIHTGVEWVGILFGGGLSWGFARKNGSMV